MGFCKNMKLAPRPRSCAGGIGSRDMLNASVTALLEALAGAQEGTLATALDVRPSAV